MSTRTIVVLALLSFTLPSLRAGEWDKEGETLKKDCSGAPFFSLIRSCATFLFHDGNPVRLSIPTTVVPGGGTALGAMLVQPLNIHNWAGSNFTLEGGSSLRQFWYGNAVASFNHRRWGGDWNTARDAFQFQIYARARGLPTMPYYGIGPNTDRAALRDYRERDISAGISVFNPLQSWLAVGGGLGFLSTKVAGDFAAPGLAPGLVNQPGFIHYNVFLQPKGSWTRTTVTSRVGYDFYQDAGSGLYSTRRFSMDVLQKFYPESQKEPNGGAGGSVRKQVKYDSVFYLGGRFAAASAADANVVPFYLMDTIGGSDINNVATLRGFQDYRFRGPDLFTIQTQYERRLWGPVGILAFYDAGEVAGRVTDLSFSTLRQSFGTGLTIWSGNKVWFRAYIGLGSGEGRHTYFRIADAL